MNARKSLLTKALLSSGAFAVLAGSAGTAVASAATHPAPLTAVTKITNRFDGGGGGSWAYDSFSRDLALTYLGKVTPAMVAANSALTPYLGMYQYNATLNDIIGNDQVMDAKSLPKVKMPNRDGFVADPRPDVGSKAKTKR